MWVYEKKLQYPVRVGKCDIRMAEYLAEQYGGADGELSAALRYLNQRYTIPDKVIGLLNDIGTEESVPIHYHLLKKTALTGLASFGLTVLYLSRRVKSQAFGILDL